MRIRNTTALLAATALALGLSACGGDDAGEGDAAGSPLAEAIAADIVSDGGMVSSEEEATCWANKIVDGIGEDRLNELGVTVEDVGDVDELDFDDGEVDVMVDSMFDCVDVKTLFAASFADEAGGEVADCIAEALDEDLVKEVVKASLAGTEPSADAISQAQQIAADCGVEGA